ncbi:glycoside hydrolase family 32 protein [Granulicella arctica]|uniref:beta-fructofuranosidase n=1 Tax=Granulicella arctica TaxID=940613 RepID=A0A7Y9TK00_9BACT|nr:glycoside hydrolase family 32 protein [Granulicella arctica]NYF78792.1 beta-fructofuranosidase [Granulicella arctica]
MPTRRTVLKTLALASAATLSHQRTLAAQTAAQEPETPIHDPLRPSYHYLPARNWMNDPCGPIYFHGQYHLFHQYNPNAAVWGDMNWAHAVSPDMVHWQRLPVALSPTPGTADAQGCFTGTAVVHDGRPTFLYTGVQTAPLAEATLTDPKNPLRESQCLAIATDDTLSDWKKLPAPVISAPPPGMKVTGFRDPSPWRDGSTWYAVVGSGIAGKGGMVLLYRSPDLRTWEYLHPLAEGQWSGKPGSDPVDTGEMWECPDFFPLTDSSTKAQKYVLIHSSEGKVIWQSGVLDKTTMRFQAQKTGELDYGRVGSNRVIFYAPKTQLDANGNRILWGWIAETRPEADYSRAGWSGLMSLPRLLTLHNGELHMQPAAQVARLRSAALHSAAAHPDKHEFLATLQQSTSASAPYMLSNAGGPVLAVRSDLSQDPKTLRINNGTSAQDIVISMPDALSEQASLHVFIDNSVLEIFIDNRFCFTHRFYARSPVSPLVTLSVAGQYKVTGQRSFALEPIWPV